MLVDFVAIISLFWQGAMGHAKIFHNYPESFMVVISFNLIQSQRVQIDVNDTRYQWQILTNWTEIFNRATSYIRQGTKAKKTEKCFRNIPIFLL